MLYPSTIGCTLVIVGFQGWEFLQGGAFRPQNPFAEVYLAILTAYSAQRELAKWKGEEVTTIRLRRGELYVAFWIAAWLAMTAIANSSPRFVVPMELKTITLGVLAIFVGTGVSAGLRRRGGRETAGNRSPEDSNRQAQVLRLLKEKGPLNAEEVAQTLNVSQPTAWRQLELLEREGRIRQTDSANPRERQYQLL